MRFLGLLRVFGEVWCHILGVPQLYLGEYAGFPASLGKIQEDFVIFQWKVKIFPVQLGRVSGSEIRFKSLSGH